MSWLVVLRAFSDSTNSWIEVLSARWKLCMISRRSNARMTLAHR